MASHKSHQEIELKRLLVGEGAADKLIAALGAVASDRVQINHVFDTDGLRLNQQLYALRLRLENGEAILTAKGPDRGLGSYTSVRTEFEAKIERRLADEILAGRRDALEVLREHESDVVCTELWKGIEQARSGHTLREVGRFENRRRAIRVTLPSGLALEVEIDRTRFADGRVDDEVEIEVPREHLVGEVEGWLDQRAAAAGVSTRPSTPKIARFYASLRERSR
jgi:uncharacterized protein YjbK